jgi:hypothetical protein
MNPVLKAGLLIGVLCGVWTFVMGFTGWYKDPVMLNAFFLVVLIEIGGLVWGLRQTAAEGRTYAGQVVAGTLMSIIAGVIIICSSLVFTMAAFPEYFRELEDAQRSILAEQGRSPAEIEQAIEDGRASATPMNNAMAGFLGALVTGIIASAIIAIGVRGRGQVVTVPTARSDR